MLDRALIRKISLVLPGLLLAAALHVHPEASPAHALPTLSVQDGACPVCATVRGGMDTAPAPIDLPARPTPSFDVPLAAIRAARPVYFDDPCNRGPPSLLPA